MTKYRVLVQFDGDRSVYVARAPELEHCSADGATRAEALGKLEEEIAAQLHNIGEQGGAAPVALDAGENDGATGELTAKVSKSLHRDLLWQARVDGIEVDALITELLPLALELRRAARRQPRQGQAPQDRGNSRQPAGPGGNDRRGNQQGGGRYHAIMEDRATFVEYVRGLDQGGGQQPGGGGRGPRRGPPPPRGPRPPGRGEGDGNR
jgi:predicted RNase H-like HicB family nuclease